MIIIIISPNNINIKIFMPIILSGWLLVHRSQLKISRANSLCTRNNNNKIRRVQQSFLGLKLSFVNSSLITLIRQTALN